MRAPAFVIEGLSANHSLADFDCGSSALDAWLERFAWSNQKADSAKTYVALEGTRVVGYYSLTTGSIHKHESPRRIAKGLANHPIGVALLARLAVDRSVQGVGLGKALLFDALTRIESAANIVAIRAVMVHAVDEPARRFYLHFGFEESPIDPYQLLLLMKDIRKALRPDA